MKYLLENKGLDKKINMLIWVQRFLRLKAQSLSTRLLHDQEKYFLNVERLKQEQLNLEDLDRVCKNLKNSGLYGFSTYYYPLLALVDYIDKTQSIKLISEIDDLFLIDFLTYKTSKMSLSTMKHWRISLIGFFKYVDKYNYLNTGGSHFFGITLQIKNLISNNRPIPYVLDKQELKIFLKVLEKYSQIDRITNKRNALILKLVVHTGIRACEVICLKQSDFLIYNDFFIIKIMGKGGKFREVMIKRSVIETEFDLWCEARKNIANKKNFLFINKKGDRLSQVYIHDIMSIILDQCGIKKPKMGLHLLRHSFATQLYNKYRDLVLVQEVLGHSDINTSRIYTHFDRSSLQLAANTLI